MSFNPLDLVVLKSIVTNKNHALDFANDNDAKIFSPETWNFANTIISYVRTYKEIPTLRVITEKLSKGKNDKLIENIKTIWAELDNIQINDNEYKHDLEKIKSRFAEKQLMAANETLSKLEPGSVDVNKSVLDLQKTIQTIKSLNKEKSFEVKNVKDYLPTFVDKFNAKKNNPKADRGLMSKYSFFDFATNGLKPADFVIVCGESGFGKSLLLQNLGCQMWLQDNKISFLNNQGEFSPGKNIIYFSLEMPYEDCFNRLLSRLSGVPSRKIENADLSKEEFARVKCCLDFIKNYPYNFKIVDIADACANDLENILIDTGEDFDAIFIDYLGIMETNEKHSEEQDWLKQGIVSYQIRAIARKYKKPILSAAQLNRKAKNKDSSENIGLSRLARSATIATHATHVLQIESRDKEEMHCDMIVHFIKNRKGPKGKGILIKDLACATLLNKEEDEKESNTYTGNDNFADQDDISAKVENLEL